MSGRTGEQREDADPSSEDCTGWDNSSCVGTPYCPPRCPRFTDAEDTALLVQPAEPDDLPATATMYESIDTRNRTMGLPPPTRPRIEDWLDGLFESGWNLLVRDDERVVGHVAVVPGDASDPSFVIFVHDDYQNRGVGSELLKQVVAHAAQRRHDALKLVVSRGNRQAISVYQNLGFDVADRLDSELEMKLSLTDPIVDWVRRPPAERVDE